MSKIEELEYELELRKGFAAGEEIEILNPGSMKWEKWVKSRGDLFFNLTPFSEYYRLLDLYRELKEAFAAGKTIQRRRIGSPGEGLFEWFNQECPGWYLPVEEYRIRPENPEVRAQLTPLGESKEFFSRVGDIPIDLGRAEVVSMEKIYQAFKARLEEER